MKEELKKELEEIAPFLMEKKPAEEMEVPFLYFEKLPDRVMDRIKTTNREEMTKSPGLVRNPSGSPISWWTKLLSPRPVWAFAGLVILVTACIFWWRTPTPAGALPELTESDIQQYIDENEDDFSEDLILEALTDDKVEINIENTRINQQDIEEYLENLDPEDIEDLL